MVAVSEETLDAILALQLTVGWAGERAEPRRLGWWDTDLADVMAGGDLFARLAPKTAAWAGLELARQAALRTDEAARVKLAHPDRVWTLFHFGFELDEALDDRLGHHKRHGHVPAEVFGKRWGVTSAWARDGFEGFMRALGDVSTEDTPAGRRLKLLPAQPFEAARLLAAALLPLGKQYPLPHGEPGGKK